MDTPAPFTDFAIPYSPYWVGGAILVVSAGLIALGMYSRSRNTLLSKLLIGLGSGFPIIFGFWELIVHYLGMDSVLGFFLFTGVVCLLGVGVGIWVRGANDPVSDTSDPISPEPSTVP